MSAGLQSLRAAILVALPDADVPECIKPGRWYRFSSSGRRGDSAGWCKLFEDERGAVFGCHRANLRETWSAADRTVMTQAQRIEHARQVMAATAEREAQQRQHWAESAQRIGKLWAECVPLVPGDPVTLYLKRRGLGGVWPLPAVLRLHRALAYWQGGDMLGSFPAMVAPLVAPDGRVLALHRTYLTRDGRKADVPTVRKLTGAAGPLAGASIALHPHTHGQALGIAEGIETALAAWCASGVPTVAGYSASNVAAWQWPAGLQRLVIFADADKAGAEAADKLLARAVRAGLQASVMTPSDPGADWCDVWAARGAAEVTT
jgi:putative DNA primase/helicase